MGRREILFSTTEAEQGGEMRDRVRVEKLLSIRELWPQAAVPAVAKSGQKSH